VKKALAELIREKKLDKKRNSMRAIKVRGLTICRLRRVYGLLQKTLFGEGEKKELLNSEKDSSNAERYA